MSESITLYKEVKKGERAVQQLKVEEKVSRIKAILDRSPP